MVSPISGVEPFQMLLHFRSIVDGDNASPIVVATFSSNKKITEKGAGGSWLSCYHKQRDLCIVYANGGHVVIDVSSVPD